MDKIHKKNHSYLQDQVMQQLVQFHIILQTYLENKIANKKTFIFIYVEKDVLIVLPVISVLNV